ncbi:MAG: VapE domain-containing protein [Prevotella sp.]
MSEKKRKKEAAEGSKEHKKRSDEGRLHRKKWKEYTATVEDIQNFLMDRILLRHNVITRRVEYRLPSSYENEGTEWQPISDRVVNSLWSELSAEKVVRAQDIYRVLESDFVPEFNPFTFYLEHLPPWNGEDYIFAMSVSVSVKAPIKREKSDACIGSIPDPWSPTRSLSEREEAQSEIKGEVEEQMLFAQYLKKWLVGMVAGWIDPHVVNNVILVLIGEQGSYKTTWFNYILPPELRAYFYTKTNASRMGRDDLLILAQYGLVCCEELDTMRPSELNQLKAAVTMPSIDERAAYAHFHEHRKHIASFCGTGNNMQFLSDPTGNRRWLPFEVESIESPREEPFEYEGIYAQAYALYQQGFQFWFSREEILKLAEHNRQFETPRLESELVQLYFRKPVGVEGGIFMSVARAMQIVSANISQKISAVYLGRAFMEQGFRRVKSCGQRGYIVEQRTGEEIQRLQRQMADDVDVDSGQ